MCLWKSLEKLREFVLLLCGSNLSHVKDSFHLRCESYTDLSVLFDELFHVCWFNRNFSVSHL